MKKIDREISIGAALSSLVVLLALGYMTLTPKKYTSTTTLLLNGSMEDPSVVLQGDRGTLDPGMNITYAGGKVDPRSLYVQIMEGDEVFANAAKGSKYSVEEMKGSIKTKVIIETPNIVIRAFGKSPDEAKEKSLLFYKAFNNKVEALRDSEKLNKEAFLERDIKKAKTELDEASEQLKRFRVRTGLVTEDQVNQLVVSNREKELELVSLGSDVKSKREQLRSIEGQLGIDSRSVVDILNIQSDSLLRAQVGQYVEAVNSIDIASTKLTDNNPVIVNLKAKEEEMAQSIKSRVMTITSKSIPIDKVVNVLGGTNDARTQLYSSYIGLYRELKGIEQQYSVLSQSLQDSKSKEKQLVSVLPTYKELSRKYDTSSIVYTRLSGNEALRGFDRWQTYPLYQIISGPSISNKPTSPNEKYAFAGALLGEVSIWGVVWIRRNKKPYAA